MKRVLIVEDDKPTRELIKVLLKEFKYEFSEAANGEEALDVLRGKPIDLVLLDMQMPKMSGLEFLPEFNKLNKEKKVPVIIITAQMSHDILHKSLEYNAQNYISKPINQEKLRSAVKQALKDT